MRPVAWVASVIAAGIVASMSAGCSSSRPAMHAVSSNDVVVPICGPPGIGAPWPAASSSSVPSSSSLQSVAAAAPATWIEQDGVLEGVPAASTLLTACGDRIAATLCAVKLRAEPSMFGPERGLSIRATPIEDGIALAARLRARFSREGFRETLAFGGSGARIQALAARVSAGRPLEPNDIPGDLRDVSLDARRFEAAKEPHLVAFMLRRDAITRVLLVLGHGTQYRVEVLEELTCDAR